MGEHDNNDTTTAVVIGASMAGLVTARVLSDVVDQVIVLERDRLPDEAATRRGVPQGRHAHVLLAAGQELLEGWFPGLVDELCELGAISVDSADLVWHQGGDHRVRADFGHRLVSMTRPLLEGTVRRRLLQRANVSITDEVSVDGLVVEGDRVTGVRVDGTDVRSDLVVDCSGRNTRFPDLLEAAGFPAPEVSVIRIDMAYGTRLVDRRPDDLDGGIAGSVGDPTGVHRIGVMLPVEGNRWIVTMAGFHGDVPPVDGVDYEGFARSLPSPEMSDLLAHAEPLSPIMTHRMPGSQRRHMERLRRTPTGFVMLGDAICSFNPIYGQGMSSAARQARALAVAIDVFGLSSPKMARNFYRQAAEVVDDPWQIAAGADFADPRTTGPKPPGTDLANRYLAKVFRAAHTSVPVARQLFLVQNLLASPASLMTPAMIARVLRAARRSPATIRIAAQAGDHRVPATV